MNSFDFIRLVECAFLAYMALIALATRESRTTLLLILQRIPPPVAAALAVALILGLVSTLQAPSLSLAANDWGHTLLWIVGLIGLTAVSVSPTLRRAARGILMLVLLAVIAQFLIQLSAALRADDGRLMAQWWVSFSNPRFVSQILVWTVPLACLPWLPAASRRWATASRMVSATIGIFGFMLMFWVGGRGALIAIVIACAACLILERRKPLIATTSWRVMAHFALGAALYLALLGLIKLLGIDGSFGEVLLRNGLSARDVLWARSIGDIASNPLLGIGPGHFAVQDAADPVMTAHPHNQVLQWASEWGLPAAAAFCVVWGSLLWRFGRTLAVHDATRNDGDQAGYGRVLFISVIAASFLALFDGVLVMPWSLLLGSVICALSIQWTISNTPIPSALPPMASDRIWLLVYGLAVITAIPSTAIGGWLTRPCFQLQNVLPSPEQVLDPRFWVESQFTPGTLEATCPTTSASAAATPSTGSIGK